MPIQLLPADVVNLIAAGEVIDSLGAVIRELVENALDAKADRIFIAISPETWRIQVADNGLGMSLEDLKVCGQAHSTSKIISREDLWRITSLGFRGEALYSIAQVADLEIASRSSLGSELGWRISYSPQGEPVQIQIAAIAPGTLITVEELFGRLPVRRKALPSISQQLKAIQNLVYQLALCHPQVTWSIEIDGKPWLRIGRGKTPLQIFPQILKGIHHTDLQFYTQTLEIPNSHGDNLLSAELELVIGLPDRCHRHRPDWLKVGVNGRIVRSPELEQSVLSGFLRTLPRDRFPVCFVHLRVPATVVDWNRHPAKAEIYLHELSFWQEKISQAISHALKISAANLPNTIHNRRLGKLLKVAEQGSVYSTDSVPAADTLGLVQLRAIGQVHNTYIVAEHDTGLWLVEQHIAHERVLYEQLQSDWQLIPVDIPIILNQLTPLQIEQLQRLALDLEPFGEDMICVRTVPAMLAKRDDCADALLELTWGGDLQTAQVAIACRSAIRNGTPLSLEQMQGLLDQWKNTRNPRTCPHGRPIYLALEETSLARFFRRH